MRVAVAGLGGAGGSLHLPALAQLPEATLVGVADLDPDRRREAETRFGAPAFAELGELVRCVAPELVIVATPPDSHAALCLEALAAGAHVLCEKPFASDLAEADRVLDAARRAGRRVALNHEFREMPIFRAVLDAVHRGDDGELRFAQVWQLVDLPPGSEPGWRGRLVRRALFEAGIHLVDLLMALFDERPVAVQAQLSDGGAGGAADAVALVTLEFSRGRLAQLTQSRISRGERHYLELRADLERASLRASFGGRARLFAGLYRSARPALRWELGLSGLAWAEHDGRRSVLARNPRHPNRCATRDVLARTIAAFRDGGTPPTSGERGRDALAVVAAAYASDAARQRISLNEETLARLGTVRLA